MKNRVLILLVAVLLLSGVVVHQSRSNASPAACTYQCAFYDDNGGDLTYAMRSDGALVSLHTGDGQVYQYPHAAPPGRYVALFTETHNPFYSGFVAVREDGATFFLSFYDPAGPWQPFGTLPQCEPIATSPSTLGNVKGKYR